VCDDNVRFAVLTVGGVEVAFPGYRQGCQLAPQLILPLEECLGYQQLDAEEQLVEVNPEAQTLEVITATNSTVLLLLLFIIIIMAVPCRALAAFSIS
jgi:hypothetical protein